MKNEKRMKRRMSAIHRLLVLGLYSISAIALMVGCQVRKDGDLRTSLSMSAYTQIRYRTKPLVGKSAYYFPTLEIYNEAGTLLYCSHNAIENAKVLKDFPASIRDLPPQQDAPRLQSIINEIPDFRGRWEAAGGKSKLTILSIGLEDCRGCSIQASALAELEQQPQHQSVAVLEISVTQQ
jgi:hypothetical protein